MLCDCGVRYNLCAYLRGRYVLREKSLDLLFFPISAGIVYSIFFCLRFFLILSSSSSSSSSSVYIFIFLLYKTEREYYHQMQIPISFVIHINLKLSYYYCRLLVRK
jgi:hypothetical protein